MGDDNMLIVDETLATAQNSNPPFRGARSAFARFALDAAGRQLDKAGEILTGAADSIDALIEGEGLAFGGELQGLASDATTKLRGFGERIGAQDAGELVGDVQRRAAANPAVAIALGAAVGAVLALVFARTAAPRPALD